MSYVRNRGVTATVPLSLAERMAAVREKHNTSYLSEATAPISLEDYMEGAKALHKFLAPIIIPSDIIFTSSTPALCSTYEIRQLASLLSGETYGAAHDYAHECIVYYTAKHILEGVIL
jgi:hypothetical protein